MAMLMLLPAERKLLLHFLLRGRSGYRCEPKKNVSAQQPKGQTFDILMTSPTNSLAGTHTYKRTLPQQTEPCFSGPSAFAGPSEGLRSSAGAVNLRWNLSLTSRAFWNVAASQRRGLESFGATQGWFTVRVSRGALRSG